MKKIYVVRGIGECFRGDVWISKDFQITMLKDFEHGGIGANSSTCWGSDGAFGESLCYEGFRRATGIRLAPGEYTTIEFKEGLR